MPGMAPKTMPMVTPSTAIRRFWRVKMLARISIIAGPSFLRAG